MIMADVWKIVFLVLGTQAVMVSCWLLAAALFPRALAQSRRVYDVRGGRATFVGLVTVVPTLLFGVALLQQGPHPLLKLLGAILVSAPVAFGLAGSAGLCDRIGAGLPVDSDGRQPWRRVLRGGVVLSFAFVLPVIGWFVLLPWTLVSGVGASMSALGEARRERRAHRVPRAVPVDSGSHARVEPVG